MQVLTARPLLRKGEYEHECCACKLLIHMLTKLFIFHRRKVAPTSQPQHSELEARLKQWIDTESANRFVFMFYLTFLSVLCTYLSIFHVLHR